MTAQCSHRKPNGTQCRRSALDGSETCAQHAPGYVAPKRAAKVLRGAVEAPAAIKTEDDPRRHDVGPVDDAAEAYDAFIARKSEAPTFGSVEHGPLAVHLYPHQADLVRWALRKGRAAIFADTGLGKTAMLVEWARHVSAHGRVLVLAPLAVASQTVAEAARFGVEARYLRADDGETRIVVTNYEMLHAFDTSHFAGGVLDESSILKSHTGPMRTALIEAFACVPYRLALTATPAPNDFTELGNHSQFLGVKTREEMLAEFFVHDGGSTQDWRIKGHAVVPFWRWVASWGAVVKMPSDLGHDDETFRLPALRMHEHVIEVDDHDARASGTLFAMEATTLAEQRAVRRATLPKRVALAAKLAEGDDPVVIWCELNDEGDALAAAIPDAVQVAGSDSIDEKVERLEGFAARRYRVMISKPGLAGFGLNWQHCARVIFVGASHSYEQTYQAIRRCWRFGQSRPVDVHMIRARTEGAVIANYRRKEADAARMAAEMTAQVGDALRAEVRGSGREFNPYNPRSEMAVPAWIGREEAA